MTTMTLSARVHLGWVAWSKERGTNGRSALMGSCKYCVRSASSVRLVVSISFHFHLYPVQMARAYSTQRRNQQHSMSCARMRCRHFSYLPLPLLTARSMAQLHQRATHSRSSTSQTHSTVTASSFPRGGTAGEKLRSYETASMRKHGVRHGNTTSNLVSTMKGARQALGNSTLRSYRTKDSRYAFSCTGGTDTNAD